MGILSCLSGHFAYVVGVRGGVGREKGIEGGIVCWEGEVWVWCWGGFVFFFWGGGVSPPPSAPPLRLAPANVSLSPLPSPPTYLALFLGDNPSARRISGRVSCPGGALVLYG